MEAEKKERESNQIIEFTKEIKKYSMEFKLKIVEMIWKIVYSDGTSDDYESNLIRRICGLLYVYDRDNGIIKIGSSPTTPTIIDEQIVIGSIIPAVEIYDVYNGNLKWKYYLRKMIKSYSLRDMKT